MIEETLFYISYYKLQIDNFEKKKKELTKLLESYPEKKVWNSWTQEFFTNRQSDRSGLDEQFASIMNQELEEISKKIKKDFGIHEIWSISYDKGDYHSPHNHGSMGLSGILYLDLPKDSPVTVYIQPWNNFEDADHAVEYHSVSIAEGDIVIVPSFVLHFSKPNKSDSKKRIIAWDMKYYEI